MSDPTQKKKPARLVVLDSAIYVTVLVWLIASGTIGLLIRVTGLGRLRKIFRKTYWTRKKTAKPTLKNAGRPY